MKDNHEDKERFGWRSQPAGSPLHAGAETCFDSHPDGKRLRAAMAVELESILQHEDVQTLLDASEAAGTVRQSELNDLTEAHEFDVFEFDLLYRELETRSVDIVDDTKEVEKAPPPP